MAVSSEVYAGVSAVVVGDVVSTHLATLGVGVAEATKPFNAAHN